MPALLSATPRAVMSSSSPEDETPLLFDLRKPCRGFISAWRVFPGRRIDERTDGAGLKLRMEEEEGMD